MNAGALTEGAFELVVFAALLTGVAALLGAWMARVADADADPQGGGGPIVRCERLLLRLAGVDPAREMSWRQYAGALLAFNACGFLLLLGLLFAQPLLPLNPEQRPAPDFDLALNTAVSFVTNTNWQAYAGELALSPLTQAVGLGTQNFLSAATGIAALLALIRGIRRAESSSVGNAWLDLTRITVRVLLPLSLLFALVLVQQGVPQTWASSFEAQTAGTTAGEPAVIQRIPVGPVASQVAIKQLGTNGGGFFNANSAHPFENPTPLTNLLETLAILALPAALCFTFGRMVGDRRQGVALYAAMLLPLLAAVAACWSAEAAGNPRLAELGVDVTAGNTEGKEARFGVLDSALWATATTAASNGSVNAMHASFMPLGGLVSLALMQVGEVIFGGVGSGLYGMLLFAFVAVFVAGLMVGRTPEYLGKKIEAFEIKMACVALITPSAVVLLGTALAVGTGVGRASLANPGAHGFTEALYAWSSAANNNGSAFAGLAADQPFWNIGLAAAMAIGRYAVLVPVLAIAGSLARKQRLPAGPGTLPTHGPTFIALLIAVVVLLGALTFVPTWVVGPIVEHLELFGDRR